MMTDRCQCAENASCNSEWANTPLGSLQELLGCCVRLRNSIKGESQ